MKKDVFGNSSFNKKDGKILILIPKYKLVNEASYDYAFPIGMGYVSSSLKQAGYNVDCLNCNHYAGSIPEILEKWLKDKNYSFICTGHGAMGYPIVVSMIETIRKCSPNSKIILGGPIITSEPDLIFNKLKPDFGVEGEGEVIIIELLKCIEKRGDLRKVRGIMYNIGNGMVKTEPNPPIQDLDSLPFPDLEDFGYREYLDNQYGNFKHDYPRHYPILCSRSCLFRCTFCYHSIGTQYRERSIGNIMKELREAVKKYNINTIAIYDDLFSIKKERIYEFCKEMNKFSKEVGYKFAWSCQLIPTTADADLLKTMKEAGCESIGYGFESINQKVLKSMNKPITPEQIDKAVKLTMAAKISITANFIFGDSAETKETAKETLDYWKNNCKDQVQLAFIQPYPGSKMYDKCVEKGIIKREDLIKFFSGEMGSAVFNMTEEMSDEEINNLYKETLRLRNSYGKFSVPSKVKKIKENRYNITVKCPYCNETTTYGNFFLRNKNIYKSRIICRQCNMRFNMISPVVNFMRNHYYISNVLNRYYEKLRKNISIKRIQSE